MRSKFLGKLVIAGSISLALTGCTSGLDVVGKSDGSFQVAGKPRAPKPTPTPAPSPTPTPPPDGSVPQVLTLPAGTARLTFSDEFVSGGLDSKRWNRSRAVAESPAGELQYYAPDAFEQGPGSLRIRADKRSMYGYGYTSGMMTTRGFFHQAYGYFEMRARVPKGNGLWPAFWLMPATLEWPPEIDIMEILSENTSVTHGTYHWKDGAGTHVYSNSSFTGPDFSADYHKFAVDWRPGVLVWYVDGKEIKRLTGAHVASMPMYILANLAVGGSWPVPPDSTTPFPAHFDIDYIRAYQYDGIAAGTLPPRLFGAVSPSPLVIGEGQTITFDINEQINVAQPGLIIQAIIKDAYHNEIKRVDLPTAATLQPGVVNLKWTTTLPPGTPPGVYHVTLHKFTQSWTYLDSLHAATIFVLQ